MKVFYYLLLGLFLLSGFYSGGLHAQDHRFLPEVEGQRIDREGYTLIWDEQMRFPKMIAYELTRKELNGSKSCGARYHSDPDVDEYSDKGYQGAADQGFEKGHLLPAAHSRFSLKSCLDASYYSNIQPQRDSLNRGAWKASDDRAELLVKRHGVVYVHSGPVPIYSDSLPSGMPLPSGFWKVLIYPDGVLWKKESYLFTQEPKRYTLPEMECGDDIAIEWLIGFEPFDRSKFSPQPEPGRVISEEVSNLELDKWGMPSEYWSIGKTLARCEETQTWTQATGWQQDPGSVGDLLHSVREASMMSSNLTTPELQYEGHSSLGDLLRTLSYVPGASSSALKDRAVKSFAKAAEISLDLMSKPLNPDYRPSIISRKEKTFYMYVKGANTGFENKDCVSAKILAKKAIEFEKAIHSKDPSFVKLKGYLDSLENICKYCEEH